MSGYYSSLGTRKLNNFASIPVLLLLLLLSLTLLTACNASDTNGNGNNNGAGNGNSGNCNGVNNCNNGNGGGGIVVPQNTPFDNSQPTTTSNQSSGTTPITSSGGGCFGGNNYQLPSTLSGNVYFRVEFYFPGGPEYESWLSPGTWKVTPGVNGWVWKFPTGCTADELRADAIAAHNRRVANGANNAGELEPSDSRVTSAFAQQ